MALRGSRIENFDELWCLGSLGGLDFYVSTTNFQKSNIGWPQQPPTEKYQLSVKNCIFDDPFHKKGPILVFLVPGMIQPSEPGGFLIK